MYPGEWTMTRNPAILSPRYVVANVLNFDIVVNGFELQSCYHIHFRTIILEKRMNTLIPTAMG